MEAPPSAAVDVEKPEREPAKAKPTGMALVRAQQHALTVPADQLPELPADARSRAQRVALPDGISREEAELAERMALVVNANCQFYVPSPHAVCGAIRDKYNAMGGPASFLSWPTSPEYQNPGNTGARSEFVNGSIYWSAATGAHPVTPLFMTKWAHYGWEAGQLGYPTTDEIPNGDNVGSRQEFQKENAAIFWNSALIGPPGLAVVKGLIRAKWNSLGAQTPGSLLGYPIEDERGLPDGQGHMSRFERGVIYWHPTYGAHPITGRILLTWEATGYESGELGYPTGPSISGGSGIIVQQFQNGEMKETGPTATQEYYDVAGFVSDGRRGGGAKFCSNGYFGWTNFDDLRTSLDNWYPRNGRVWQVANDSEVWKTWCKVTGSEAYIASWTSSDGTTSRAIKPSPRYDLEDGTICYFRENSTSGGYTIDFNTPGNTQNFKVHVA
ncbi:hypothetical protein P9990_26865 (plasmid) [Prescottella equi]|uniref:LGFP repeat-containing protein n=1 Tax=Rhodococcus hoagii TaxID=43767 RepID=UPI0025766CAB|nr:hypothetical protein [Prescottella equi]WJJ14434.1 hypothetical protein P9990_26865 [Prescottella equi]